MSRIENSVRDAAKSGFERNTYGSYYRPAALDDVFALLEQAERIHPLGGATRYLRAGYLAWAGRWPEAAATYEEVLASFPSYASPAMVQLAWVYGLMGNLDRTRALLDRHNAQLLSEGSPLPPVKIEQLNLEDFWKLRHN